VVKAEWEAGKHLWFALCCNLPIQGISADAMMRALQLVHMRIRQAGLKARIIATIHDELLLEAPESEAQDVAALVEQGMTDAFTMTFPGAPTRNVVEARIGTTWAALKDD
jgi:DNA polymerase-1